jgi:hypothetical protein
VRIVLAVMLLAHGVAHLPGFLVSWQLRSFPELPYRTTILGGAVDVGAGSVKAIGLVWLLLSALFVAIAAAALMRATWWPQSVYVAVGLSTALCVVGWPETRLGLVANAAILLLFLISARTSWL